MNFGNRIERLKRDARFKQESKEQFSQVRSAINNTFVVVCVPTDTCLHYHVAILLFKTDHVSKVELLCMDKPIQLYTVSNPLTQAFMQARAYKQVNKRIYRYSTELKSTGAWT